MSARRNNLVCGFTLIEMLVSLAVLGLALTIVGVVFSVATNTTRQAAAYSEVQNWLRQFTVQLEEDLKYCEPASSVLVLVGRTQAAALTQADLDARRYYRVLVGDQVPVGYDPEFNPTLNINYSDPRADILMFFTGRLVRSQAPPRQKPSYGLPLACYEGAKLGPLLVVYGHAALDDAVWSGSGYDFAGSRQHIEQTVDGGYDPYRLSRLPANRWHLARRATIVQPDGSTGNISFNSATRNRLARCVPEQGGQWMPGDAAYLDVPELLARLNPSAHWSAWTALASPYNFDGDGHWAPVRPALRSLLYAAESESEARHHVATVVENPPVDLQTNLGVQMLPGCVWFQVEFLMPEDPRNSLDYSPPPTSPADVSQRYDLPRWTPVEPGQTYVFVPDTAENRELVVADPMGSGRLLTFAKLDKDGPNNVANRRVRMWPYAIRVTVRVIDRQGRLEEPLVRSIVHRFD